MHETRDTEKQGLPAYLVPQRPQSDARSSGWTIERVLLVLLFAWVLLGSPGLPWAQRGLEELQPPEHSAEAATTDQLSRFDKCSLENIRATNFTFLDAAKPISRDEYVNRRDRLARALSADGKDAFVVEPGYTFSYYANITQQQWEVWEPEERPFLMIVQPNGSGRSKTTFLVPSFEAERARLLGMPFADDEDATWVTYEEHWNPYATLASSGALICSGDAETNGAKISIVIDEEMRDFIQRGLASQSAFSVHGLAGEVERVRQTKTLPEVEILRAVNTGTIEAIRAIRPCLTPGLTENDVVQILDNTLRAASLEPFFDIVLFDEDASNPHGGTDGTKVLTNTTMVLIDVGAHLCGYSSDVCRSFFPPFTSTDEAVWDDDIRHKLKVWDIVFEAQTQSLSALTLNHSAADVDLAARRVIDKAGYSDAFTHRVGHGIGIKAHESPYLNKGNTGTPLRAGMTFTSEPGIYLVDHFGVRHEDVLLVKEDGLPDVLSGVRATNAWKP